MTCSTLQGKYAEKLEREVKRMNETIEKLYKKLDALDSIIDQQALEISQLKNKIDNAIEYIKNEDIDICTIRYNDIVDTKNELLEILGDKE